MNPRNRSLRELEAAAIDAIRKVDRGLQHAAVVLLSVCTRLVFNVVGLYLRSEL